MPRSSPWYICLCFQHLYSQLLWCVCLCDVHVPKQRQHREARMYFDGEGVVWKRGLLLNSLFAWVTRVSLKTPGASLLSSSFRSLKKKKKRRITNIPTQTCLARAPSSKRYFTVAVGTSDPRCLGVTRTSIGFQPAVWAAQGPF